MSMKTKHDLFSLAAGLLFGLGLLISDMANPARVLAFLDMSAMARGAWDPTLVFVMGAAMSVSALAWRVSYRRAVAAFGRELPKPPREEIDARLIGGAAMFGLGWGLIGICPGPALAGFAIGGLPFVAFTAAMLAGMGAFALIDAWLRRRGIAAT